MELASTNDDFLFPHDPDTTEKCVTIRSITDVPEGLTVTAGLSIVCYIYLFWMYFGLNSPVFKRHPTSMFCSTQHGLPRFLLWISVGSFPQRIHFFFLFLSSIYCCAGCCGHFSSASPIHFSFHCRLTFCLLGLSFSCWICSSGDLQVPLRVHLRATIPVDPLCKVQSFL